MNKFLKWFDGIFVYFSIIVIGIMSLSVIASITLRVLFKISLITLEEFIVFLFIGSTFLGSVVCVKEKEHIAVENLIQIFPNKIKIILRIFIDLLIISLHLIIAHFSWKWISIVGNDLSTGFRISIKYIYSLLPISAYFIIFYQIRDIIEIISKSFFYIRNK